MPPKIVNMGRGRGVSHGGGRGEAQGKGGPKETSKRDPERTEAAGGAETDAGAAENDGNKGYGATAREPSGDGTGSGELPLGPTEDRYTEGDSQQRLETESGSVVKRTKQRGGALLMQPLMPPGWTPPTGPPPGAPRDKDEDMTETVVAEPGGGANEATGAEGAGDAEQDGDKDMENEEPGELQYQDGTEEQGRDQGQGQRGKFFSQDWITQVKDVSAGKISKMPLERWV